VHYKRFLTQQLFLLAVLIIPQAVMPAEKGAPVSEPIPADISKRLDKLEQFTKNQGLLDMLQQLEHLQAEINRMRGEIEVQSHTLEQIKKRQHDLYTDMDRRMQQIESGSTPISAQTVTATPALESLPPTGSGINPNTGVQTTETAPTVQTIESTGAVPPETGAELLTPEKTTPIKPTEPTVATAAETTVDPAQAQADYQKAFKLLKLAQYNQAIKEFNQFLDRYPNSQYSDNAQYWMGEAYYVMQQYEIAITVYEKLITQYPESQKLTHALLKIGYSYHELGQLDEAKRRLEDLKQRYPGTTAARLAEERLKQIKSMQQ